MKIEDWQKFKCEDCNRMFIGDFEYNAHMASKTHKKEIKRKEKLQKKREKVEKKF